MKNISFSDLDDDVVIHVCKFLEIPSILCLRQTSNRFLTITKLLVIWRNLFNHYILKTGYPFPQEALSTTDASELEYLTRRSYQVASYWLSSSPSIPRVCQHFNTFTKGTGISEIKFLPGHDCQRFVTVSKGIWSVISCWDLGIERTINGIASITPRKIAEWSPKSVILTGFAVNSDPDADGLLAVAVNRGGLHSIEILALRSSLGDDRQRRDGSGSLTQTLSTVQRVETNCVPMTLQGSVLVVSDSARETHVVDWKTTHCAVLQRPLSPDEPDFEHNKCIQVLLTQSHVFVVRAQVVEVYTRPELQPPPAKSDAIQRPISQFTFGWVDGVSIVPQLPAPTLPSANQSPPSVSIAIRAEMDDPWSSDTSKIELYTLHAQNLAPSSPRNSTSRDNPDLLADFFSDLHLDDPPESSSNPYTRRPTLVTSLSHTSINGRRAIRCPTILSGKSGTSLWIQPPVVATSRNYMGLVAFDVHSSPSQGLHDTHPHLQDGLLGQPRTTESEILVGALFPGPLRAARNHTPEDRIPPIFRSSRKEYGLRDICTTVTGAENDIMASMSTRYWMSMDYAEEWGRVILGSSDGTVTFVEL